MHFLPRVYLQEVRKGKETPLCNVCPENMCPGAKSAVEQAGLVLGGCSCVPLLGGEQHHLGSARPCRLPALLAALHCLPCSHGPVWPILLVLHPSPPASLCKNALWCALGKPPRNQLGWSGGRPGSSVQGAVRSRGLSCFSILTEMGFPSSPLPVPTNSLRLRQGHRANGSPGPLLRTLHPQ